jgi:hypothetical protein
MGKLEVCSFLIDVCFLLRIFLLEYTRIVGNFINLDEGKL